LSGGAVAHLHKPFSDEKLLAAIAKALGMEPKNLE